LNADAVSQGADIGWSSRANEQMQGAYKDAAGKMGAAAEFEADSSAWEAKQAFAAHASAMGGIAGMNSGSLAPGEKPLDTTQLAVSGNLDGFSSNGEQAVANDRNSASNAAWYSAEKLPGKIGTMEAQGLWNYGGTKLSQTYQERGGGSYSAWGSFSQAGSEFTNGRNWVNNDSEGSHRASPQSGPPVVSPPDANPSSSPEPKK
jgi:hypothetical protein